MSETATTAPAAGESTATAAPAATETTSTAPAKAPTLADMKAARREKAATIADQQAAAAVVTQGQANLNAQAAGTPPKPDPATVTIDMDAGDLKKFATLSREKREALAKVKELEGKIGSFGKFEKASALAKEGKHYDAAREAGIDVDAAIAELLGQTNGQPTATQIDKDLKGRLEALEADNQAMKAKEESRQKAAKELAMETDRKTATEFVKTNQAKYPFLAKSSKLVDIAFKDYADNRAKIEAESGEEMSGAEQAKLLLAALSVHEEDWANALGDKPASKTEAAPAGPDGSARAGVTQPPVKQKAKLTFEELKAERLARRKTA
jgi:hypothetical protein